MVQSGVASFKESNLVKVKTLPLIRMYLRESWIILIVLKLRRLSRSLTTLRCFAQRFLGWLGDAVVVGYLKSANFPRMDSSEEMVLKDLTSWSSKLDSFSRGRYEGMKLVRHNNSPAVFCCEPNVQQQPINASCAQIWMPWKDQNVSEP